MLRPLIAFTIELADSGLVRIRIVQFDGVGKAAVDAGAPRRRGGAKIGGRERWGRGRRVRRGGVEAVRAAFAANFASGRELGAAVAVYHRGRPVVDLWGGWFDADRTSARTPATRSRSCSAPARRSSPPPSPCAVERGWLDYDEAVSRYWPEFAAHGKRRRDRDPAAQPPVRADLPRRPADARRGPRLGARHVEPRRHRAGLADRQRSRLPRHHVRVARRRAVAPGRSPPPHAATLRRRRDRQAARARPVDRAPPSAASPRVADRRRPRQLLPRPGRAGDHRRADGPRVAHQPRLHARRHVRGRAHAQPARRAERRGAGGEHDHRRPLARPDARRDDRPRSTTCASLGRVGARPGAAGR